MKDIFKTLLKPFTWLRQKLSNARLKARLKYLVRYIKRACVREQRIYYILLNPNTREIVVCNNNEYQNIKRSIKKQGDTIRNYVYAVANPWNNQ